MTNGNSGASSPASLRVVGTQRGPVTAEHHRGNDTAVGPTNWWRADPSDVRSGWSAAGSGARSAPRASSRRTTKARSTSTYSSSRSRVTSPGALNLLAAYGAEHSGSGSKRPRSPPSPRPFAVWRSAGSSTGRAPVGVFRWACFERTDLVRHTRRRTSPSGGSGSVRLLESQAAVVREALTPRKGDAPRSGKPAKPLLPAL